jgi:TPP-dependent pyruvate/acetoin dehydrogenase alpha subunit
MVRLNSGKRLFQLQITKVIIIGQFYNFAFIGTKAMHDLKNIYKEALRIRKIEQAIADNYQIQGQPQLMRCPIHLSIGQELLAAAFCSMLTVRDKLFSTHRCHAHYLAKGGSLNRMLAEIHGRSTGCIGGRGGSMHLTDIEVGMIASIPIVASAIPLAVGSALASLINGTSDISSVIFGDACVEEGVTHESMNFASVKKLPIVFVCENNLYSVYTNISERQPNRDLTLIGKAHDLPSFRCDGDSIDDLIDTFQEAVSITRNGDGPTFVVVDTYRWLEHCGPSYDNHLGYRSEAEFLEWRKKDGLESLSQRLMINNLLTKENQLFLESKINDEISEAFKFAINSPMPKPSDASNHIYA